MLWAAANNYLALITFNSNPIFFIALLFLIPVWRDLHFYLIHRMIHWPPLYKSVHKLHHKNVNPSPWSGLAMHPVEHLLYFSGPLLFLVVPFATFHILFALIHTGLAPVGGHTGFERVELGEDTSIDTSSHAHYLHHKFFECNYADGIIPLDKWFNTFHNGSEESEKCMVQRFKDLKKRSGVKT